MPSGAAPSSVALDVLRAALATEQAARREAEARASGAEAMVAHLKLLIAKLRHERFGASSERSRKLLDQMELQLEELEAAASEDEAAAPPPATTERSARRRPVRGPLPAHLPRERVVLPSPSACPCCGGRLSKLGEDITETLEVVPRQWKVVQTVREKFACRSCEAITQPPAPFHPIARGRAGPNLLATILEAKFGQHLPLNRQSESFAREGTFALKPGLCVRRVRFVMLSPDPRQHRRCQARKPVIGLSEFPEPPLLFTPPFTSAQASRPQPEWSRMHAKLRKPGVTLQLLWEEYRVGQPDGYGYSL